ncbi:MAG: peptidoglycan editing factor PgeF [Azospirillaceae bacterium]|nr:peptidoglycan editing factor PgeF [Azospirillaceae bacterium]
MITLDALNELTGLQHGFLTRNGGVSQGLYASLNCGLGSRDDPVAVATNRARAMERFNLPADRLIGLYQVHSAIAITVTGLATTADPRPRADALVTRVPGLALGILTADCAPVLFADRKAGVIGAAHAGWRGAQSGVVEATLRAMVALGASLADITAGIGPCIGAASYEVGPEFPHPFLDDTPDNAAFFTAAQRAGHFMFDLRGYLVRRLTQAGVGRIACCAQDTVTDEPHFFSYRRATLRGESDFGRGLSAIALAE